MVDCQLQNSELNERDEAKSKSPYFSPLLEAVLELRNFEQTQHKTTSKESKTSFEESSK